MGAQFRLTHASMSIGDAIQIGPGELYIVGLTSFHPIEQAPLLLPQQFGGLEEDPTILSPLRHNEGSESSEGDENGQSGDGVSEDEEEEEEEEEEDAFVGRPGVGQPSAYPAAAPAAAGGRDGDANAGA